MPAVTAWWTVTCVQSRLDIAVCSRGLVDRHTHTQTHRQRAPQYIISSLSDVAKVITKCNKTTNNNNNRFLSGLLPIYGVYGCSCLSLHVSEGFFLVSFWRELTVISVACHAPPGSHMSKHSNPGALEPRPI